MSITKIAKSVMEVTADYQKLSDLNVAFYNQDINTSILQFNVTRNDAPVPLGKSNVEGYIVLLHEDGSRVQDNLVIENEEHGVIQYTIPREFLKHTGKAAGQVYIAVKGRDDTAVMRQFSFDIKQDLLTGFSSSVKLEYIKTFDDLKEQIKHRVDAIEEAIANGEDYVAQMVETLDTGKKEIAATVSKANTDINKVATDAKNVVTDTSNTAVATVNAKAKEVTDAIANNQVVKITDVLDYQKQKITADNGSSLTLSQYDLLNTEDIKNFDGYVTTAANSPTSVSSGYFKRKIRTGYIEVSFGPYNANALYRNSYHFGTKTWFGWEKIAYQSESATTQKQKITADTGAPLYDLDASKDLFIESASWGNGFVTFYLSAGAKNNPTGSLSWVRGTVSTYGKNSNILAYDKEGAMYTVVCANGVWGVWDKAATGIDVTALKGTDTGWITYNTLNGILANTAFAAVGDNGYKCAYRKITANGITRLLLRVNISNITTETVAFAALPKNIVDNAQTGVGRTNGANQKTVITLRPSGDLSINVPAGFSTNAYVYHQFEWTL